jgi:hypothetical protein
MLVWKPAFAQIDLKKCTIKLKDGTSPTPNEMEITIGEGNLTFSETRNIQYVKNRGLLDNVRLGDEEPVDVKIDANFDYYTSRTGGTETIWDVLTQSGEASDWVSSDSDACNPYALDLEVTYEPTPATCGDKEVLLFSDFRYEKRDGDIKAGTLSISGKCNITRPTATRSQQSS